MQEQVNYTTTNTLADSLKEYIALLRSRVKTLYPTDNINTITKMIYINVIIELEHELLKNGIPLVENERREHYKTILSEAQTNQERSTPTCHH